MGIGPAQPRGEQGWALPGCAVQDSTDTSGGWYEARELLSAPTTTTPKQEGYSQGYLGSPSKHIQKIRLFN